MEGVVQKFETRYGELMELCMRDTPGKPLSLYLSHDFHITLFLIMIYISHTPNLSPNHSLSLPISLSSPISLTPSLSLSTYLSLSLSLSLSSCELFWCFN